MTTRTYYLSKYALSGGIKELEGEVLEFNGRQFVEYGRFNSYALGTEIHETRAEAVMAAEAMRVKKIASLRKQIAKLEAMKFEE